LIDVSHSLTLNNTVSAQQTITKQSIVICSKFHHYRNARVIQCYLPPDRADIPAFMSVI